MICGASPLSSSKDEFLVYEDGKSMGSGNLSSTLQKLYIWEKKLYDEVRVRPMLPIGNFIFAIFFFQYIV